MTIEPDVRGVASSFNLDPALLQALVLSEGNILKAVQCSLPSVTTRDEALRVAARSLIRRAFEFIHTSGLDRAYVGYFAGKWAPVGVTNDPMNLNANLPKNLERLWLA